MMSDRDTKDTHTGSTRAPYEPPRLLTIELAAEEVLAGACKMGTLSGVNSVTFPTEPCMITSCTAIGS